MPWVTARKARPHLGAQGGSVPSCLGKAPGLTVHADVCFPVMGATNQALS